MTYPYKPHKVTREEQVYNLLADGKWHSGEELARRVSHRFGGYLFTLKAKGVEWEKRRSPDQPKGEVWYDYRLVPTNDGRLF